MLNISLLSLALALQAPANTTPIELAWGDLNSDGLLDLLIVDEENAARFYLNTGDGDFAERTLEVGLADVGDLRFGAWQDLDADGHTDLLLGTGSGVRLFQNVNGRSLVERTAAMAASDGGGAKRSAPISSSTIGVAERPPVCSGPRFHIWHGG